MGVGPEGGAREKVMSLPKLTALILRSMDAFTTIPGVQLIKFQDMFARSRMMDTLTDKSQQILIQLFLPESDLDQVNL